jgi:hypothetical protein
LEALVNEDPEKVARKFWAYVTKYYKNLGKKAKCLKKIFKETSTEETERGGGDDEKFGTENMKILVYPKPPAIFKNNTSFASSLASPAFLLIRSALK